MAVKHIYSVREKRTPEEIDALGLESKWQKRILEVWGVKHPWGYGFTRRLVHANTGCSKRAADRAIHALVKKGLVH